MYTIANLVLKSYMPRELEPGMLFITKLHQGTLKETVEIWQLNKVPLEPLEEFITTHGAPVEPYIIDNDEEIIAHPEEISWWDDGVDTDEFRDITPEDITFVSYLCDGLVAILCEEDPESGYLMPIRIEGKVVLGDYNLTFYEEEEYEEEEEEDVFPCSTCNGTGEAVEDFACPLCKGTGADPNSEWFKRRFGLNYGREY